MKFAKTLLRNQVPEWSQWYMDYKALKKLVRAAARAEDEAARDSASAPFFYALDRNAEMVDTFFNSRYAEYSRRLRHILERVPLDAPLRALDTDERAEVIAILLELRAQLRKLAWYAEVNKRGFTKILKKFDKKAGTHTQTRYLASKIDILRFANGQPLAGEVSQTNELLNLLAPNRVEAPVASDPQDDLYTGASDFYRAIDEGDAASLRLLYIAREPSAKVCARLLLRALATGDADLVDATLEHCNLDEGGEINGRNLIHRLVIQAGHAPIASDAAATSSSLSTMPSTNSPATFPGVSAATEKGLAAGSLPSTGTIAGTYGIFTSHRQNSDSESDTSDACNSLSLLLSRLPEAYRPAIAAPDQNLRTPLHYAGRYGLPSVVRLLIDKMKEWQMFDSQKILGMHLKDSESLSPLDLAVTNNHPVTTKALLSAVPDTADARSQLAPLVLVAARLESAALLQVLLDAGLDVDFQDPKTGETALYTVAKHGFTECAKLLLDSGANMELKETTFGWTPLFVAAVDGSTSIVDLLLDAGCVQTDTDTSGWTAKEHAALRGHLELMKKLNLPDALKPEGSYPSRAAKAAAVAGASSLPVTASNTASNTAPATASTTAPQSTQTSPPPETVQSIGPRRSKESKARTEEYIKSFGHRYLADPHTSLVLVTLGSHDLRTMRPCVELQSVPVSQAGQTELDTALSLVVSSNCDGEPFVLDLPAPEYGISTETITFSTQSPDSAVVYFDLVPTYSAKRPTLGRAVALLSNIMNKVGNMRNLNDTVTVPLLEAATLRVLGTVCFSFQLVTPFVHPDVGVEHNSTYWKSLITTRVIGHRGLGKNTPTNGSLQLGENTVESFIQAANLGASYVEFDVQLTRDKVPVIYHDFVVGDSGYDIPMHSLTLDQFMNIHRPSRKEVADDTKLSAMKRSNSLSPLTTDDLNDLHRLQLSRDFKTRGFKGNLRGHSIQSKFATLAELFKILPPNVGFNIECKYPMLDEAQNEDLDNIVVDINEWCDTVLKVVYDNKRERDIIFSSFHPDVCIFLALKQPSIPVLFLTEGGSAPMMDVRASSLQEAVRLCNRWNLLGIVSESSPLIDCPRLAQAVKENGLVCFTYGALNNQPDLARRQLRAGVDAVIVDSVMAVRKELTEDGLATDNAAEGSTSSATSSTSPNSGAESA